MEPLTKRVRNGEVSMSYLRALTIAPQALKQKVERGLREDFAYKVLRQNKRHFLVAYSGRYLPAFDPQRTCTLAVDARNVGYRVEGNQSLAKVFDARIEITIGISIQLSRMRKIPEAGRKILRRLEKIDSAEGEDNKEADRSNLRFDLSPAAAVPVTRLIKQLVRTLDRAGVPYRACLFDGQDGQALGSLSDDGLYVGPAAYALANWEQQVLRTEQVELIVNETSVLLDGDDVPGLP